MISSEQQRQLPSTHSPSVPLRRREMLAGVCTTLCGATSILALAQDRAADEAAPLTTMLEVGGARIEVHFDADFSALLRTEALAWVRRSADAVVGYFARFPVSIAELWMQPVAGGGVRGGASYGDPALVRIRLGRETTREQFLADWIMTHEMIHLAIPDVPRSQLWLHEGIATYVEGVARARAGLVTAQSVLSEWMRGMPHGLPEAGDQGLDHTPTWGRTYWGGAMFCLLADVKIRQRSAGRVGLQQALQGVLAAGGNYNVSWPVKRTLAAADKAVGQTTLTELHASMADRPVPVDLDMLWRDLGVTAGGPPRDDAPLAAVRRAIFA